MKSRFLLAFPLLLLAIPLAGQQTVTLEPVRDNTLYFDPSGMTSNGSGPDLFVGINGGGMPYRALLAFDVATVLPAGARVLSAQLTLRVSRSIAISPMNVGLHRVLMDWGEGGSVATFMGGGAGAQAQAGDATWVHAMYPNVPWSSFGGDFDATASGTAALAQSAGQTTTWTSTAAMVADVQSWLDAPQGNFGWLLLSPETGFSNARRLDSREATTASYRPQLVVGWDMPPPPASVTVVGTGCATGTGGVFTLAAPSVPRLGNLAFRLDLTMGPPGQLALDLVAFDISPNPVPVAPNCQFHLGWIIAYLGGGPFFLDGSGGATFPAPIPNDAALTGISLAIQTAALDGTVPTGFVVSNALQLQLGR